ncbi:peptide ABC transporter substrate-binding protein [Candidatus Saccharibacteria bacterium]|nr:peptide ABC transporter substrate-binding protein [Candidatus Saccharibacteria bacterium]
MKNQVAKIIPGGVAKRRWRRVALRHQRQATNLTQQADQKIEKLLIRRFDRLISVRRFVLLWVLLFVLLFAATIVQLRALPPYYQTLQPASGGLYSEGLIGSFTNANPLYASGTADVAISRLVFSGLFGYDNNNTLVGNLAHDWQVNPTGKQYTVNLKRNITWQDGQPFTADDVVFTYQTIQNIEAQSLLYTNWQGITVTKLGPYTVTFDLPNQLTAFPYALTNGIVPKHLLKDIAPQQLRSASFNTSPIGTGPFEWKFVEVTGVSNADRQQRMALSAFKDYWGGRPKLDGFSVTTFSDDKHLITAFKDKQLNAMSGLESRPDELANDSNLEVYTTPETAAVMSFFNNSRAPLNDVKVRQALVSGVNRKQVATLSQYANKLVDSPLLKGQLGYDPSITQMAYNPGSANQLLDQAGWARDASGQRSKAGQPLTISLSSQDTVAYTRTAQFLQEEWGKLGIKVNVHYYSGDDLQSVVIAGHDYDALLHGISIGVDPDVFAFWHSSQASVSSQGRLNISEYKSTAADQALEAGRTRSDQALRATKYHAFLAAWAQDAPALALYQPNFLYITRSPVYNYQRKVINTSADRFYNVNEWMVRQQHQNLN